MLLGPKPRLPTSTIKGFAVAFNNASRSEGGAPTGEGRSGNKAESVELVGLYWHFVDVVWIVLFTLVYLIPS